MRNLDNIIQSLAKNGKVDAFLVAQKGELLAEHYFNGYETDTPHEIQSVTKSLQSLLVGIMIEKKFLGDEFLEIYPFFRNYHHLDWHNGKQNIRIEHLLNMCAGLEWNEGKLPYHDETIDASLQMEHHDWLEYALAKDMENPKNDSFLYSSANPILLSYIIKQATPFHNADFAERFLFSPLDITYYDYQCLHLPDGMITADAYLLPLDMLKIGQMVLQNGVWGSTQVISQEWLEKIQIPHWQFVEKTPNVAGSGYKYGWWHTDFYDINNKKVHCFFAWGIGGQYIFIVPTLQIVAIFTGNNYEERIPQLPFEVMQKIIGK